LVYDSAAVEYVAFVGTELSDKTEDAVDRSLLVAFAELASSCEGGAVADLGCGPGRVSAFLSRSGLDTIGLDISPGLLRLARRSHPATPFVAGGISDLPFANGCLRGAVCWYSIIYAPPEKLGRAFEEIRRVLTPGGPLLLAFQAGPAEPLRRDDAFGSGHPLTSYRHDPDDIAARLEATDFSLHATTLRSRARDHEVTSQAFILAHRSRSAR
jgi:SAM-dependent methyltransferase